MQPNSPNENQQTHVCDNIGLILLNLKFVDFGLPLKLYTVALFIYKVNG